MAAEFDVGSLVRLIGLSRTELNHHVGQVVSHGDNGRIGVSLNKSIFTAEASIATDSESASSGGYKRRPSVTDVSQRQEPCLSIKPENLRKTARPAPGTTVPSMNSMSGKLITRTFGERGFGLPDDVADRIANYLSVLVLDPSEVRVSGWSSSRGDYPVNVVLNAKEDEWWISASNSMRDGIGEEYLEFSLGGFRRVSYVALKIPPLPYGPLSVRMFHVLALRQDEPKKPSEAQRDIWVPASPNPLQTLDQAGLQEFALVPPVDTTSLRLVFTVNAAATVTRGARYNGADCIGLFQVAVA
jgi:hypothetical protein